MFILVDNLWLSQVAPGVPKYNGKYEAPTGPKPNVLETGEVPANIGADYQKALATAAFVNQWTSESGNRVVPGYGEKADPTFFQNIGSDITKLYNGLMNINSGKPATK
jgi:hypothetical protein